MAHGGSVVAGLAIAAILPQACTTSEPKWRPGPAKVTTRVFDENGNELADASASNLRILGLGPRVEDPMRFQDPQDQDLTEEEIQRRKEADIRNTFGSTVLIRGDLVTKRYFMNSTTGVKFTQLITSVGGKPPAPGATTKLGGKDDKSILGAMLAKNQVEFSLLPDFETVPGASYGALPGKPGLTPLVPIKGAAGAKNDLLLVTAKAPDLLAFENALNLFYSNIPQVEIEVKVVEFTQTRSLSFGTGGTSGTNSIPPAAFNNLSGSKLVSRITSQFPLSPPAGSSTNTFGLFDLGGIHDGWQLDATLQVLMSQGKADVLSSPKLVVRNGGEAAIATMTDFPFPVAKISGVNTATSLSFKPVGVNMGIRPIIAGTETIILQIQADVSAVTGFAGTEPVDTPIVSRRTAFTSVHVPNGKTTVIGGLKTQQSFDSESKIPILGDIPILGYLFRQTTTQTSETELQFFITPRILIGSTGAMAK